jgi:xanthine dehydrogenase YagS FAD-binding subunit
MRYFDHINTKSVAEAISVLKDYQGRAKLIAGGTDLLGELKDRVLVTYPEVLVNIKTIPDMDYIREEAGVLKIGALTKLREIAFSPIVKEKCSILAQASISVGSPQIRNMGTIGGNLCQDVRCWYYRYPHQIGGCVICRRKGGNSCGAMSGDNRYHALFEGKKCMAVCPSDTAVALAALEATIKVSGPNGDRTISIDELYNPLGNDIRVDEMITEVQFPVLRGGTRQSFSKFRLRNSIDFAIVSVASVISSSGGICEDARIVLGAVAARPIRAVEAEQAIRGKKIDTTSAEAASKAAVANAAPLSRNAYKIQIAQTLVKRALLS